MKRRILTVSNSTPLEEDDVNPNKTMKTIKKSFTDEERIEDGFEYKFEIADEGLYLIEIIASARSWWQNLLKIKFGDDDLAVKIDDVEFPKLNAKRGLFDGEAAWNGNNLKGLDKTNVFIANLSRGAHRLTFLVDKNPNLKSIQINKAGSEINYVPVKNNPAEDGNGRQWITLILSDLPLKSLAISAVVGSYPEQKDCDDLKLIIDSEIQLNENEQDRKHKYWYWSGKSLNGQEKKFRKEMNKPRGLHYIELWADKKPKVKSIDLNLGQTHESGDGESVKRIPTVDDPEWTGNFDDDSEQMILARAIFGEARSLPEKGRTAVGWTIRNRVDDPRWADSFREVILQPGQFSAFNEGDKNIPYVQNPIADETQADEWRECYAIAGKVISGEVEDPTGGANHYFSDYIDYPEWTKNKNAEFKIKIGNTLFYNLKQSGGSGFAKAVNLVLISVLGISLVLVFLYVFSRLNERCISKKTLSGTAEAEQYKHFFINRKTNKIQAVYFGAGGNFLRTGFITKDGHPKSQLKVFPEDESELMGYLQEIPGEGNTALMIKNNEYDEPRDIFRTDKPILEWKWLDKKHVDVFFDCGSSCQHYRRFDIDTGELEDEGTIFLSKM